MQISKLFRSRPVLIVVVTALTACTSTLPKPLSYQQGWRRVEYVGLPNAADMNAHIALDCRKGAGGLPIEHNLAFILVKENQRKLILDSDSKDHEKWVVEVRYLVVSAGNGLPTRIGESLYADIADCRVPVVSARGS